MDVDEADTQRAGEEAVEAAADSRESSGDDGDTASESELSSEDDLSHGADQADEIGDTADEGDRGNGPSPEGAPADPDAEAGSEGSPELDADLDDSELVDELPDGSEGWGLIEESSLEDAADEARAAAEKAGSDAGSGDGSKSKRSPSQIEPTKSDILGFVKETSAALEDGEVFLPGQEWQDDPPERYLELDLVQPDGRLTRPGACMLTYASKVMKEASAPRASIVARLNSEGVDGFARRALEIDPEDVESEDGFLDGFL